MNTVDKIANRYLVEKQAGNSKIIAVVDRHGDIELRTYEFQTNLEWQHFKEAGDNAVQNMQKTGQALVKAIKKQSGGVEYETIPGYAHISPLKHLYISITIRAKRDAAAYDILSQAIKSIGLREYQI